MNRVGNQYRVRPNNRHYWGNMILKAGDTIEVMTDLGFTVVVQAIGKDTRWEWVSDSSLSALEHLEKDIVTTRGK